MEFDVNYDTKRLWNMLQELDPKRQKQALKGGLRKAGNEVRRIAVRNMKASGLKVNREMEKGIRTVVYTKVCGFKVTVGTKKSKINDWKRLKQRIIPLWAEGGTVNRTVKKGWWRSSSASRNRGAMPAFKFMERTMQETENGQTERIRRNLVENIEKTVKKYGGSLS